MLSMASSVNGICLGLAGRSTMNLLWAGHQSTEATVTSDLDRLERVFDGDPSGEIRHRQHRFRQQTEDCSLGDS